MPRALRLARVYLTAPIAFGNTDQVTGWISEEGTWGVRVHDKESLKGRSQFFPGHLVERVEELTKEPGQ